MFVWNLKRKKLKDRCETNVMALIDFIYINELKVTDIEDANGHIFNSRN